MFFDGVNLVGQSSILLHKANVDPSDKYILKDIQGLGPPDIDVTIKQSQYQGGLYQNRRPQGRQIIVTLGYNPDFSIGETVSDLRIALYGLLMAEGMGPAKVQLMDGTTVLLTTNCYVSKFEINPFSREPESQITFECISPYLEAPDPVILDPLTLGKVHPHLDNPGNAPTGFYMRMYLNSDFPDFHLTSQANPNYKLWIDRLLHSDHQLIIDTRPGSRTVQSIDVITHQVTFIHDDLSPGSDWLMLGQGTNIFDTDNSDFDWLEIQYTPQYWGI